MNPAPNSATVPADIQADVNVAFGEWPDISNALESIRAVLAQSPAFQDFAGMTVEISIVLADDNFVQNLNKTYRGKNKPTNVLSFPQDPEPGAGEINLGDVILAYQTVKKEAQSQGKSFMDHTSHLLVHGILHLLGHDHEKDEEAEEMESLETLILEKIGIKNPYRDIVK